MKQTDPPQRMADDAERIEHCMLFDPATRKRARNMSYLLRELARFDGTKFDTPRMMHAIRTVREECK